MKGFLSFSENIFVEGHQEAVDQIMYGIWCPPCDGLCNCPDPFFVEIPVTPDYGIWPPLDCIK